MLIIQDTPTLQQFCQTLAQYDFITVDLEFQREKTYYPQLGLIQVACLGGEGVIDPLATGLDLSAFIEVLRAPNITKVFHSCRQDIEILYQLCGFIPTPLFDTQIAAQVCGFGASASYEALVRQILGIELDKSCRLTNWCIRPLNEKQLAYAISDVTHLIKIYEFLRQYMQEHHREDWIADEMAPLLSPKTYTIDPYEVWERIRPHSHNAKYLTLLRELAAWRENRARHKNLPRQTIIKDECLLNIAASRPHSMEELAAIRNMRADILQGKLSQEILDVVALAEQIPPAQMVKPEKEKSLSFSADLFEMLKLLLNIVSTQNDVYYHVIASEAELRLFAGKHDKGVRFLHGWRKEIFGQHALALRDGKLSFSYNPQTKKLQLTTPNT